MAIQSNHIFINLPVKDLNRSMQFFSDIGFEFNEQMTDKNAACMIVGRNIYVMMLVEDYFKSFTGKALSDSAASTEVIVSITADSRAGVDEIVNNALAAGASASNDKMDNEFMYGWSFEDIDGHLWEVMYMPESDEDSDDDFYG
ncbi:VOC family protein [Planococcus halotolerans]|uniref:VOC family protein n=1 Tax=Planococcus halotolerans TaxID=2233542 RepID=UPI001092A2AF|nr:VOC family protein [Planococcus halotolerans]QHJ70973.1 glyoxalase/bleomycin resistance/extradiol dioxygenase family protein [Planococcus halotolerans]